jgi:hypothetical protein
LVTATSIHHVAELQQFLENTCETIKRKSQILYRVHQSRRHCAEVSVEMDGQPASSGILEITYNVQVMLLPLNVLKFRWVMALKHDHLGHVFIWTFSIVSVHGTIS